MKNKNLYKELSMEIGVMDEKSTMFYYYGFIRYIIKKLKKKSEIQLPEFGKIFLRKRKSKILHNIHTRMHVMTGGENFSIIFKPCKKLKDYFKLYEQGQEQRK